MRHWLACCLWGDGDPGETSPPPVRGTAEPLKRLPTNALVAQAECSTNIETHLSLRHGLRRMSWGEHDSSLLYAFVWCFHILCRTFKMFGHDSCQFDYVCTSIVLIALAHICPQDISGLDPGGMVSYKQVVDLGVVVRTMMYRIEMHCFWNWWIIYEYIWYYYVEDSKMRVWTLAAWMSTRRARLRHS